MCRELAHEVRRKAEVLLYVAEGVPHRGLVETVAEPGVEVKGLAAAGKGFAVIPELSVGIGDVVQRIRLTVGLSWAWYRRRACCS